MASKTKTKSIPRGKWLLVRPLVDQSRETEHGLLLPATDEKEQKAQGTVEAVGDEIKGIKPGDTVVYGAYVGENLKINEGGKDVEYKLLLDEDIIAFVK